MRYRKRIETESKKEGMGYVPITVSVGYAHFYEDIANADEFIKQADLAMYESKQNGKNQCTSYDEAVLIKKQKKENDLQAPIIPGPISKEVQEEDRMQIQDDPEGAAALNMIAPLAQESGSV